MSTVNLQIDGMSCGHCVARVTKTLAKVNGISVEHVDIGSARLAAVDPSAQAAALVALHDAGYEARAETSPR
jgi:copper chaperone CopZ